MHLFAFFNVENRSSNDFTRGGCVAADPRGVQCCILVQYGHATLSELINF